MKNILILAAAVAMLTACGENKTDRAASGAAIGAGVGALGGAITGGSVSGGALVGGIVGGAAGGLTDKNTVDLGKPIWK